MGVSVIEEELVGLDSILVSIEAMLLKCSLKRRDCRGCRALDACKDLWDKSCALSVKGIKQQEVFLIVNEFIKIMEAS